MKGISIVICCYNSEKRLPSTLKYIGRQKIDELIRWEVIIVNNASTDKTTSVAKEFQSIHNKIDITIVKENQPGLSSARIKGVRSAKYSLILFCDDDMWLHEEYVIRAYRIMKKNTEIGALGGRGSAVSDIVLPFWFDTYQGSYACGVQALDSGDVTDRGYIFGAGMVLRKNVFLNLLDCGFQFYCSGRKEGKLLAGDDSEICKWFILIGLKLWYDEKLVYKHYMPANRLTKNHLEGLHEGFLMSREYLGKYNLIIQHLKQKKDFKTKIWQVFILFARFLFGKKDSFLISPMQYLWPTNKNFARDRVYYEISIALKKYFKKTI